MSSKAHVNLDRPSRVRYGVLGFACSLSMITYLDRACIATVAGDIQQEFGLSDVQKGLLFSAFALSYAVFEIPNGWLGDRFGPRRTLIRIVVWWSAFTALTGAIYPSERWPMFAFLALLAVRFLFGMGEAGCYPNISRAFHNWFPMGERGFAQGAVWMAGRFAGGITPLVVSVLLFKEGPQEHAVTHWRHTFWIFGSVGLVWCVLFWWWFRDKPEQNADVNKAEIALINEGKTPEAPVAHVPWGRLLTDLNLWTLCLVSFCAGYGWYFNITYLPGYLESVFHLSKGEKWSSEFWRFNFMAGAPLLFGSLACLVGGLLTDFFVRRTGNRRWSRSLCGAIGQGLCAICYFLTIFADSPWMFVLAVAIATFWSDLAMGPAWASCLDIGHKYSGIVAGCLNSSGNLGCAVAGFVIGWILDLTRDPSLPSDAASQMGWTINFLIFGCVSLAATVLWLRFDATRPVVTELALSDRSKAGQDKIWQAR